MDSFLPGPGGKRMQGLLPIPSDADAPEQRRGADRRRRPTPRFSMFALRGGRRRGARREHEREGSFIDVYPSGLLLAILWVVLMNACDSFFTLIHLQGGGTEVNPVAAMLLNTGRTGFVVLKSGVIATALLVLCVHKNFHLARVGLWAAAGAYTLLFAYHLLLFVI